MKEEERERERGGEREREREGGERERVNCVIFVKQRHAQNVNPEFSIYFYLSVCFFILSVFISPFCTSALQPK